MKHLSYFFVAILFFSCKDDLPKGILSAKKMEAVFWDVTKVDTYTKEFIAKDSNRNALFENSKMKIQLFAFHKITKQDYDKSLSYYMNNPKMMQPILDSVANRANTERLKQMTSPTQDPHLAQ